VTKNKEIQIELLAPARNAEYGKAAVNHGADALYIGAPRFGARSAASNTIGEIEDLIHYAHLFRVKVYCTLNTILFNGEIEEAAKIIKQLYGSGVDGIIIQDLGLLEMDLPPVPLIASTQTHNITAERVCFFEKLGFKRVILARELSISQIKEIRTNTSIELESFVHGAICVSYSGQCYMSEAICGRSGNRGICAQPCRSLYNLLDGTDQVIVKNKHLLSQKDLNLSAYLSDMMDAGITSFKIEGRLKDLSYIKNITSYYRKQLDSVIENKQAYTKASSGNIYHQFEPDPERSFNRGFTNYFILGRKEKTGELNTQKSIGKRIGYIIAKGKNWISLDNNILVNADGICYFGAGNVLYGTSVDKVEGDKVYLKDIIGVEIGTEVFRNHDQAFEKILKGSCADRKIGIALSLSEYSQGFMLEATDSDGNTVQINQECEKLEAQNPQLAQKTVLNQLSKLGDTLFELTNIKVQTQREYFIPARLLNEMRRNVTEELKNKRLSSYIPEKRILYSSKMDLKIKQLSYTENIANDYAKRFYLSNGVEDIEPAFELTDEHVGKVVMTTKYCIRYQMNACKVFQKNQVELNNPLYLKDQNHTYRLNFDCKNCVMQVILEK
jgi:23S rRNA 5-hydroxycytidine C2501 synthase